MRLFYNPKKATQAAALLVRLNGGQMGLWRMLKLIYLFDRESLIQTGATITGDELDNLRHGGLPSQIYDNTKPERDKRYKDAIWTEYLSENAGDRKIYLLRQDFAIDQLSDFEVRLIEEMAGAFENVSDSDLYRHIHDLPEFKDPRGSSVRIHPEEILRNAGWTDEEISVADRDAKREYFLNQLCK